MVSLQKRPTDLPEQHIPSGFTLWCNVYRPSCPNCPNMGKPLVSSMMMGAGNAPGHNHDTILTFHLAGSFPGASWADNDESSRCED